jgi:hypothetical protein
VAASLCLVLLLASVVAPAGASPAPAPARSPATGPASPFAKIADDVVRETPGDPSMTQDLVLRDREDYAAHLRWQREFSRQSWEWHLHSTKLLMYVVMGIVLFGLFITYLQFTQDRRGGRAAPPDDGRKPDEEIDASKDGQAGRATDSSTLKLGPEGVEITSQVIGLLVLGFSLAFFYFYVKDVYPMQELELKRQAKSAPAPVQAAPPSGESQE